MNTVPTLSPLYPPLAQPQPSATERPPAVSSPSRDVPTSEEVSSGQAAQPLVLGDYANAPFEVNRFNWSPQPASRPSPADMRAQVQQQIQTLAREQPDQFRAILEQSFGDKLSPQQRERLLTQAQAGELPLPTHFDWVEPEALQGALGAYSPEEGGRVFISSALAQNPQQLAAVLLEESGHHLDQVIGGPDASGDEGERFRLGIQQGAPLSSEQLQTLASSAEPETGTLEIDGQTREVEFIFPAIAAYLGKVAVGTAVDTTVDLAISALLGQPFDARGSIGTNAAMNALPFSDGANKVRKANELRSALQTARQTLQNLQRRFPAESEVLMREFNQAGAQLLDALENLSPLAAKEAYDSLISTLDKAHRLNRGGRVTFQRHGNFDGADYHGALVNGRKNPAPLNGQLALDHSIPLGGNSNRRLAVEGNHFVVLDRTSDGIYHGHQRSWDELDQSMQRALQREGIVDRRGRVLRAIE